MNPNSKASQCLAVLRDGPATSGEVASETGLHPHLAGSHMSNLFKRGKVTRTPYTPTGNPFKGGSNSKWLWALKEEVGGVLP